MSKQSSPLQTRTLTPILAAELLSHIDYVLLDIDGVLWSGDHVFPGIPETIQWLRQHNKNVRFLSNNSTMTRQTTAAKFMKKGIPAVRVEEIYTSGFALSQYLKQQWVDRPLRGNVLIVGEKGLHDEIRSVLPKGHFTYGLELNGVSYDAGRMAQSVHKPLLPAPTSWTAAEGGASLDSLNITTVVAGLDLHFNMAKLAVAGLCLQQQQPSSSPRESPSASASPSPSTASSSTAYVAAHRAPSVRYFATNEDPQIPIGTEGFLLPGAGCMIQALNTVSGRTPEVVCGKPEPAMGTLLFAAERITDPRRCLMIGDRLTTDIAFGNRVGCWTMLVLSGAESMADVERVRAEMRDKNVTADDRIPHFVADSLASLKEAAAKL